MIEALSQSVLTRLKKRFASFLDIPPNPATHSGRHETDPTRSRLCRTEFKIDSPSLACPPAATDLCPVSLFRLYPLFHELSE